MFSLKYMVYSYVEAFISFKLSVVQEPGQASVVQEPGQASVVQEPAIQCEPSYSFILIKMPILIYLGRRFGWSPSKITAESIQELHILTL